MISNFNRFIGAINLILGGMMIGFVPFLGVNYVSYIGVFINIPMGLWNLIDDEKYLQKLMRRRK